MDIKVKAWWKGLKPKTKRSYTTMCYSRFKDYKKLHYTEIQKVWLWCAEENNK
tara:strand:- start:125 stop:283 length:159 start_codon:yes stop_codon:yes gene_type:complete